MPAFDTGPLTWVKPEIDKALTQALVHLGRHAESGQLRFARTHVHQAAGAMQMIGLEGAARLALKTEALLASLTEASGVEVADGPKAAVAARALRALGAYLDALLAGVADKPLRLNSVYRAVCAAFESTPPAPGELFAPGLAARAPRRFLPREIPAQAAAAEIRRARSRFQQALLVWLKGEGEGEGAALARMREAVTAVERVQAQPPQRAFWWVAGVFFEGLQAAGAPGADPGPRAPSVSAPPSVPLPWDRSNVQALCAKLDLQMRRLTQGPAGGSHRVSERLLCELLYAIALKPGAAEGGAEVRAVYALDESLPGPDEPEFLGEAADATGDAADAGDPASATSLVAALKPLWQRLAGGEAAVLDDFRARARALAALNLPGPLRALATALAELAAGLNAGEPSANPILALETATALLLLEQGLAPDAAAGVAGRAAAQAGRLVAARGASTSLAPAAFEPAAFEPEDGGALLAPAAKGVLDNLWHIEAALDAYFREPDRQEQLDTALSVLDQTLSVLGVLELGRGAELLQACRVQLLKCGRGVPAAGTAELIAESLSALGFYVDAARRNRPDGFDLIAPVLKKHPGARLRKESRAATLAPETVEAERDEFRRRLSEAFEGWRTGEAPPDAAVDLLERMAAGAELAGDADLAAKASYALECSRRLPRAADEFTAAVAALVPVTPPAPALVGDDDELLTVFLTEADEVLGEIGRQRPRLVGPEALDALQHIRRSFHTLKGSGRMVGLHALGDAAWALEKTLNAWLPSGQSAGPELIALVGSSETIFRAWVAALAAGRPVPAGAGELADRAHALGARLMPEPAAETPATAPALQSDTQLDPQSDAQPSPQPAVADPAATVADPVGGVARADDTLREIFLDEAGARLVTLRAALRAEPADLEAASRAAHTLCGSARTAGFVTLAALGRAIEDKLGRCDPTPAPGRNSVACLRPAMLAAADTYQRGLDHLHRGEPLPTFDTATAGLQTPDTGACQGATPAPNAGVLEAGVLEAGVLEAGVLEAGVLEAGILEASSSPAGSARGGADDGGRNDGNARLRATGTQPGNRDHTPSRMPQPGVTDAIMPDHTVTRTPDLAAQGSVGPGPVTPDLATSNLVISGLEQPESSARPETAIADADGPDAASPAGSGPQTPSALPAFHPAADAASGAEPRLGPDRAPPYGNAPAAPLASDAPDPELFPLFAEEAQELLAEFSDQLVAWREAPGSVAPPQALRRALHTLKGGARMAGALAYGGRVHALETELESAAATPAFFDHLRAACDALAQDLDRLRVGGGSEPDPLVAPGLGAAQNPGVAPEPDAESGASAADPATTARPAAGLEDAALAGPGRDAPAPGLSLRLRPEALERLIADAAEVGLARTRLETEIGGAGHTLQDLADNIARLRSQLREVEVEAEARLQAHSAQLEAENLPFDPLEFDRYTRFQELTRMLAESVSDVATAHGHLRDSLANADSALAEQRRHGRALQEGLSRVRMVPLSRLRDRLDRVVRQTAAALGKRAEFTLTGGWLELDRGVLDQIAAPLEHLLRNAVVHGLEAPQARRALGKPEIGRVEVSTAHAGNQIRLRCRDDGAGLDLAAIRVKARELGWPEAEDEGALLDCIFKPGFSTAVGVSELSGRGVGLDVVRDQVTALGGRVRVSSRPGEGAAFNLDLPLTLAVARTLVVRTGDDIIALPADTVAQVQQYKAEALRLLIEKGEVRFGTEHFPLADLATLLGRPGGTPLKARHNAVLLLKSGDERLAVRIDALVGEREAVTKPLSPQLARLPGVTGAGVLGDGRVALILNPLALARRPAGSTLAAPTAAAPAPAAVNPEAQSMEPEAGARPGSAVILVVDDSITVRKAAARVLGRAGYRVVAARDGLEALELIQVDLPDLLLVDIEMPRMNGFELLKALRAGERTSAIPAIMITSRTGEKHRRLAFELGASAYLGKPYDEAELLAEIGLRLAVATPP